MLEYIYIFLLDPDYDPKQAKKFEKELKKMEGEEKKHTLRGTAKAVALTQRLSPKAQRKKDKIDPNIAKLKVSKTIAIRMVFLIYKT